MLDGLSAAALVLNEQYQAQYANNAAQALASQLDSPDIVAALLNTPELFAWVKENTPCEVTQVSACKTLRLLPSVLPGGIATLMGN